MDEITKCPNCKRLVHPEYLRSAKTTGEALCCTICVPNEVKTIHLRTLQ